MEDKSINIILAEESRYPIGSFVDKVKKGYVPSSILSANRNNIPEVIKLASRRPVLTTGWLIFVPVREVTEDLIQSLNKDEDVVVYVTRNKEEFDDLRRTFLGLSIDYRIVDNLRPSKGDVESYVMEELNVDKEIASYICKRHNYYLAKVSETVEILRGESKITKEFISKYTDKSGDLSFSSMFDYIIGVSLTDSSRKYYKGISHAKVIKLVKKYEFALDFLIKYIIKRFEHYLFVYDMASIGAVSLSNYKFFYEEYHKELKGFGEYGVKKALEAFESVSYDKLFYLYNQYKRSNSRSVSLITMLKLLRLSKL